MPTLVNQTGQYSSTASTASTSTSNIARGEETANASEFVWIRNELLEQCCTITTGNDNNNNTNNDDDDDGININGNNINDSTLSSSALERMMMKAHLQLQTQTQTQTQTTKLNYTTDVVGTMTTGTSSGISTINNDSVPKIASIPPVIQSNWYNNNNINNNDDELNLLQNESINFLDVTNNNNNNNNNNDNNFINKQNDTSIQQHDDEVNHNNSSILSTTLSESQILIHIQENETKKSNNNNSSSSSKKISLGAHINTSLHTLHADDRVDICSQQQQHSSFESIVGDQQLTHENERNDNNNSYVHDTSLGLDDTPVRVIRKERIKGVKENEYILKYKTYVDTTVSKYKTDHPSSTMPNYRTMDANQKYHEHQRIIALLERLGISTTTTTVNVNEKENSISSNSNIYPELSFARDDNVGIDTSIEVGVVGNYKSTQTIDLSSKDKSSPGVDNENVNVDTSLLLLSPPAMQPDINVAKNGMLNSAALKHRPNEEYEDNSPIEIARTQCQEYDSPDTSVSKNIHGAKRFASTSGKRGCDVARTRRMMDGSFDSIDSITPKSRALASSPFRTIEDSIERLSIDEQQQQQQSKFFVASQSPISQCSIESLDDLASHHSRIPPMPTFASFDDDNDDDSDVSDIEVNRNDGIDSIQETTMLSDNIVRWGYDGERIKEAPTAVGMKHGGVFYLNPLQTSRNQKKVPTTKKQYQESFSDPFCFYPVDIRKRLTKLCRWVRHREKSTETNNDIVTSSSVIFSLSLQQSIDMIIRLMMKSEKPGNATLQSQASCYTNDPGGNNSTLEGKTLVVARSKEDIDVWSRAFREGSNFSVIDHSSLPLKQRKSPTGGGSCAKYDIVLTTYDALKSPDITITLDSMGYALTKKVGLSQSGWYTTTNKDSTTSTSSQLKDVDNYKLFSVLHKVTWRRVVFLDIVGRKSYLSKANTNRAAACVALNATKRIACFISTNDDDVVAENGLESFVVSDPNAQQSLVNVMRLKNQSDNNNTNSTSNNIIEVAENILSGAIVDFHRIKVNKC